VSQENIRYIKMRYMINASFSVHRIFDHHRRLQIYPSTKIKFFRKQLSYFQWKQHLYRIIIQILRIDSNS